MHDEDDANKDDSGYFSDGELSTTDLEEVDDDEFFRELETNDDMEVIKHYETPVKPVDLPLLDIGSIILTPTNTDVKEATDSHDNVGDINIDMTSAVNDDHGGEMAVATIVEVHDKKMMMVITWRLQLL